MRLETWKYLYDIQCSLVRLREFTTDKTFADLTIVTHPANAQDRTRADAHLILIVAFVLLTLTGCGEASPRQYDTSQSSATTPVAVTRPTLSESARAGETLFNANCSLCHGVNAAGTHQGPPLIHKIYEPGHHSDFSFRNAVRRGVRQHHWQFGDMAPVAGISADDEGQIICYIREMQRANGIFEGDAFGTQC